jgi:probable phosphoglycerate mutase
LAEAGLIGASKVGHILRDLKFDAIYSSPLQRAKQTAEIILSSWDQDALPPKGLQFSDNLKEINLMLWEGMPFDEVAATFPDQYAVWRDRPEALCMEYDTPQGTVKFFPVRELYEQATQFWQEILPRHAGETILLVAHSGINRALICTAVGLGSEYYKAFEQTNCSISVLNFSGELGQPVQLESVNLTAHLGENLPKFRGGKGVRLLLVRHGETDWNREKRFQGQIDVPLNPQGREQSRRAAIFLQTVKLDRAVSSPMLRPQETAEIILQMHAGIELELYDELREINHGEWEGKLEAEIEAVYSDLLQQWQRSPETVQMPNGENLNQIWERAISCWHGIVASAASNLIQSDQISTVLVVAHDAINKAILCHLAGLGPEHFWTFKQGNGAVSVIDYPNGADGRPTIQALNITSHLSDSILDRTAAGAL